MLVDRSPRTLTVQEGVRLKGWVLVTLALLCAFAAGGQQTGSKAKTQTLKAKLTNVKQKKVQVKQQLHEVKKQVWYAAAEVDQLDDRITGVEKKLSSTKSNLTKSKVEQARLSGELNKAHKSLLEKKAVASRRIRSIYVSGNETMLSVLIGARDVADFASRKSLLERIAKRDHDLFDDVKALRDEIATKKRRQDSIVNEIAQLRARQQMQEQELKSAMHEKTVVLNKLRNQRDDLQEELAAMEKESSRIEAQIRAYQMSSGNKVTPYKGHFMLPVNGRFSSGFGVRVHPISHVRKMHTGQDIAAPSGTTIRAAGPGVVISTGWRGGYGNTVIIDHGGGISTLYGHCSKIFAHAGQKVAVGDAIAAVGTTGYSTGPHLHFEVRVNGSPVNPRRYL